MEVWGFLRKVFSYNLRQVPADFWGFGGRRCPPTRFGSLIFVENCISVVFFFSPPSLPGAKRRRKNIDRHFFGSKTLFVVRPTPRSEDTFWSKPYVVRPPRIRSEDRRLLVSGHGEGGYGCFIWIHKPYRPQAQGVNLPLRPKFCPVPILGDFSGWQQTSEDPRKILPSSRCTAKEKN